MVNDNDISGLAAIMIYLVYSILVLIWFGFFIDSFYRKRYGEWFFKIILGIIGGVFLFLIPVMPHVHKYIADFYIALLK